MKKHQVALLVLLATAAAISVGCGSSSTPTFTQMPFMSDRTVDPATPLFIMKLDGSNVTPVPSSNDDSVHSTTASANIKTVAYVLDEEVWTSNADGSNSAQLTHVTDNDEQFVTVARVSPDGKKILYAVADETSDFTYDLWIMNVDGSGATQLISTAPTGMDACYTGSFSSDSSKITFACYHDLEDEDAIFGLFTMKSDGSDVKQVLTQDSEIDTPAFTPNEKQIVYASYGMPGEQAAARKHAPSAAHFNFKNPRFENLRPFTKRPHTNGTPGIPTNIGIASVNVDGSNAALIIPGENLEVQVLNSNLYYSVFGDNAQIWKSNLDGTSPTLVSDGTANDFFGICYCGE